MLIVPLCALNHSYFPHVLSSFSHDDFPREERASQTLHYLVNKPPWISQAPSLLSSEINLSYVITAAAFCRRCSFLLWVSCWIRSQLSCRLDGFFLFLAHVHAKSNIEHDMPDRDKLWTWIYFIFIRFESYLVQCLNIPLTNWCSSSASSDGDMMLTELTKSRPALSEVVLRERNRPDGLIRVISNKNRECTAQAFRIPVIWLVLAVIKIICGHICEVQTLLAVLPPKTCCIPCVGLMLFSCSLILMYSMMQFCHHMFFRVFASTRSVAEPGLCLSFFCQLHEAV